MDETINTIYTFDSDIPPEFEEGIIAELIEAFTGDRKSSNGAFIIFDTKKPPDEFKSGSFPKFLSTLRKALFNVPCTILGKIEIIYNQSAVSEALMLSNIRSIVVPLDVPVDATFTIEAEAGIEEKKITSSNFTGEYAERLAQGVPLTVLPPETAIMLIASPVTGRAESHGSDYRPITTCTFRPLGDGKYIFLYQAKTGFDHPETILVNALKIISK